MDDRLYLFTIYLLFLTPICPRLKHWQRSRPQLEELLLRKQNTKPLPTDRPIPTQATHPLKSEKFSKWQRANCQRYKILPTDFSCCLQGYSEIAGGEDVWHHSTLIFWSIASKSAVSYGGHRPITSHSWTLLIDWKLKNSIGCTCILNVTLEACMVTGQGPREPDYGQIHRWYGRRGRKRRKSMRCVDQRLFENRKKHDTLIEKGSEEVWQKTRSTTKYQWLRPRALQQRRSELKRLFSLHFYQRKARE